MKILLYPTSSCAFFFRELIKYSNEKGHAIDWRMLVLSWRHVSFFDGLLSADNLFYVPKAVNARMVQVK